jgi:hypothetical protein
MVYPQLNNVTKALRAYIKEKFPEGDLPPYNQLDPQTMRGLQQAVINGLGIPTLTEKAYEKVREDLTTTVSVPPWKTYWS